MRGYIKRYCLLAFLVLLCSISRACDCDRIVGANTAQYVFKGRVIEIAGIDSPYRRYDIKFEVFKVLKGKLKRKAVITISAPCLDVPCCGIPFKVNDRYKIVAFTKNNRLYTDLCTETEKL